MVGARNELKPHHEMIPQIISAVLGVAVVCFLWWLGIRRIQCLRYAPKTEGVIVEMIPVASCGELGKISRVPRLRFRGADGSEHVVTRIYSTQTTFRPEFSVGQRVRIAYDPKTGNAEILKPAYAFRLLLDLVMLSAGILAVVASLIFS